MCSNDIFLITESECIQIAVPGDVASCSLVDMYHHFRVTFCLHLQGDHSSTLYT
jgi:hypothetical protein